MGLWSVVASPNVTAIHTTRAARADMSARFVHERRLARESREHEDLSRCYEAVMLAIERSNQILATTRTLHGGGEPLPQPSADEYRAVLASAFTFGSLEVQGRLGVWSAQMKQFNASTPSTPWQRRQR